MRKTKNKTNQDSEFDSTEFLKEIGSATSESALKTLNSSMNGLFDEDVEKRLDKWGPNTLKEEHEHPLIKFLKFFWGPIPWMIEAAAILSFIVKDIDDFIIILIMLLVNAVIGFVEEFKASNAIDLLKQKLAHKANVKRNNKWVTIDAVQLVPGDIVHVKLGEIVPADMKVLEGENFEIDQSTLTGESLPVEKKLGDLLYMGTTIRRGEGDCVVAATAMNTQFGHTAGLAQQAKEASHYQKSILKIGKFLIYATLALVALIITFAIIRHESFLSTLKFCLILTVASIPVAMPAVLSVTMAVGAVKLAKHKAIVSRLVAIEELASMNILCSDKTGTLTTNKMTVGEVIKLDQVSEQEVLAYACLASREESHDPLEEAIFSKLDDGRVLLEGYNVKKFIPFDPNLKRTEATVEKDGNICKISKGAPQIIVNLCEDQCCQDLMLKDTVYNAVKDCGARGYRTLGVAKTNADGEWRYIGLLTLYDPPREDSASTIVETKNLGVDVKMITGDHAAIAQEIASKLNIGDKILTMEQVEQDIVDKNIDAVVRTNGFAQVHPEDKYEIVDTLQNADYYIGMTGDGVNDAPALRKAHVGIAVSGATDAARDAADLVLTSPGLSVISNAIKESRQIFQRMNSYTTYRIAETIRIILFMTFSILAFKFYPLSALMIIILALLNDGPIMMIAYDNTDTPQNPVRWDMKRVLTTSFMLGVLGVIWSFTLFLIAIKGFGLDISNAADRGTIMTFMFLKLSVAGHMTIYLTRSGYNHFWEKPYPSLSLFIVCETTQILATIMAVYGFGIIPGIGWKYAAIIWGYAIGIFIINDLIKVGVLKRLRKGFLKHEDWVLNLEPETDVAAALEPEQDVKIDEHAKASVHSHSKRVSPSSRITHP